MASSVFRFLSKWAENKWYFVPSDSHEDIILRLLTVLEVNETMMSSAGKLVSLSTRVNHMCQDERHHSQMYFQCTSFPAKYLHSPSFSFLKFMEGHK